MTVRCLRALSVVKVWGPDPDGVTGGAVPATDGAVPEYVTVSEADCVAPVSLVTVAVIVFVPVDRGTEAVNVPPLSVAATPLTVTPFTPEPALAMPVTVTGVLLSVAPGAGEVIEIAGGEVEPPYEA